MSMTPGSRVLVVGASAGIAQPLVYLLAEAGCDLVLAGRNAGELQTTAADIKIRHQVEVHVEPFDALELEALPAFTTRCWERFGEGLDGAVLCHGALFDQATAQADPLLARQLVDVNFTSAVLILEQLAARLAERGEGFLAAISSVAGDRGRQSNYLYGSTKGALTTYLQGLRNRLHHHGVRVLTIKPGFVDTPMTRGELDPDSRLVASPQRVARDIFRALNRKNTIYTPWFWRWIMLIIRSLPEFIFKRLKM